MGPAPEPRKPKVMRVSTRCRTIDELIAAFATLVDEHSLVVLTDQQRVIGSRQPFVVELADGTFVMKGEAEVVESTPPPRGRLRLKFLALDASGREVHQRMLERKRGAAKAPPRTPTEPAMKALVRIPEPGTAPRDPTPLPAPPVKPAPPAPFARPVPSPPSIRTPTSVPVVPSRATVHGMTPIKAKLPAPPAVPSVPSLPSVPPSPSLPSVLRVPPTPASVAKPPVVAPVVKPPVAAPVVKPPVAAPVVKPPVAAPVVKPPVAWPVTDPGTGLPSFEAPDEMHDERTAVDTSIPEPEPPPAPSIEAAVAAEVAKPRAATPSVEGDRTPGSPYILPANPFGDVAPESLEAFVECMVYEETGQFSLGEDGMINEFAPPSEPELAPDPPTTPAFPMSSSEPAPRAPSPPPVIEPPPPSLMAAPPPPVMAAPPPSPTVVTPPPVVYAPPPKVAPTIPVPAMPLAAPPDQQWPPFDASGSIPVPFEPDAPSAKRPPWKWIGIGAAVLGVIVLIAVIAGGGGDSERKAVAGSGTGTGTGTGSAKDPPKSPADAAPRAAAIDAGVAPDAAGAEAVAAAPDAGVTGPTPPPVAADECHLTVNVRPDGAHLKLDSKKIGDAPFDAAIPCAAAPLTIYRSHYETVIKRIKPVPGEPVVLNVKMVRPEVKLTIVSKPPGAMIKIDGKSYGKAPTTATLKGYTDLRIEATLKGYEPYSKKFEIEKSAKQITIPMKKAKK